MQPRGIFRPVLQISIYRKPFLQSQLLEVGGHLQHEKGVMHVIAEDMVDRSVWLGALRAPSGDFR